MPVWWSRRVGDYVVEDVEGDGSKFRGVWLSGLDSSSWDCGCVAMSARGRTRLVAVGEDIVVAYCPEADKTRLGAMVTILMLYFWCRLQNYVVIRSECHRCE